MKYRNWIFSALVLSFVGCKAPMAVSDVQIHKNTSITSSIPNDEVANNLIAPYKKSLDEKMNTKISHTNIDLNRTGDNSNLGNLLADFTYDVAEEWSKKNNIPNIDAALINIGGIRSTIGKGDILLKHIYEVMPFENELVIIKMKGSDLDGLFNYYLQTQKNNPVSRLTIATANGKITTALVNNIKVNPNQTYYIATSDYLALGGDNMSFFKAGEYISTGEKLRDLYIEKFKQHPEIVPPSDIRLIFNK